MCRNPFGKAGRGTGKRNDPNKAKAYQMVQKLVVSVVAGRRKLRSQFLAETPENDAAVFGEAIGADTQKRMTPEDSKGALPDEDAAGTCFIGKKINGEKTGSGEYGKNPRRDQ